MANRTGNYCAVFVTEGGTDSNLAAHSVKDFVYYNMVRAWKGREPKFPFIDSHGKNYNVRDGSDWEKTLKPRIHDRLNKSKNIILFLSSLTKNSRALREEIDFGINAKGLPVITVYPEYKEKSDIIDCKTGNFKTQITELWDRLPKFRNLMTKVPTIHLSYKKALIEDALEDPKFKVASKGDSKIYFYKC
jgi:hypothetical protein